MEAIVIARNRFRMYTAFIMPDGRRILNIAVIVDGLQQCVSILFDEDQEASLRDEDQTTIERLIQTGRRSPTPVATPMARAPVRNAGYRHAA